MMELPLSGGNLCFAHTEGHTHTYFIWCIASCTE